MLKYVCVLYMYIYVPEMGLKSPITMVDFESKIIIIQPYNINYLIIGDSAVEVT